VIFVSITVLEELSFICDNTMDDSHYVDILGSYQTFCERRLKRSIEFSS